MAMPKFHRDRLEAVGIHKLMVTLDPANCLLIYPMPDWIVIEDELMGVPNADPYTRALQRLYVGHATEMTFDGNGRVLLPSMLRERAGIGKKAVLLGQGKKCELWSEERYEDASMQWPEDISTADMEQVPKAIRKLSI